MNAATLHLERVTPGSDRLPMRQKIGFGLGAFLDMWGHWLYPSLAFHVFNIFLGVAPGLISTVQMVKIFIDAASDAIFGWISDNTRTRYGRRRPFILVGGVLAGIGLPLMFAVGRGWTDTQYFIFMLVSMVIYVPVMSCFNMPWVSLGSEMTPDYHERTTVMAIRNAIQKLPELAMFFAAQFTTLAIFHDESGKPDILRGAQVYTAILGAIMVAVSIAIFLLTRERYYEKLVSRTQTHIPFADTLWRTLRCQPFRAVLLMALAYGIGTAMVAALGYYNTVYYVCHGDVALATKWNTAMGVSGMVFGFLGIPFFTWLARRRGKRIGLVTVFVLATVTLTYLRITGPFIDWLVNYDYIVEELCVEKDEAVNDCCGSCVLTDNLEKVVVEENNEEKLPPKGERPDQKELLPSILITATIPTPGTGSFDYFATNPGALLARAESPSAPPPKI